MTTIFSILNDILHKKHGDLHTKHDFTQAMKSPYLFQRWVSMTNANNAYLVNETLNRLYTGLENSSEKWYQLCYAMIVKDTGHRKTAYIKKPTEKKDEKHEKEVTLLMERNQLSRREVEEYLELENHINATTSQ